MKITASQLYKKISKYDNVVSHETILKAYLLSKKAHTNQYRSSGEEYFTHPLAVADYLAEMKLDSATIITPEPAIPLTPTSTLGLEAST